MKKKILFSVFALFIAFSMVSVASAQNSFGQVLKPFQDFAQEAQKQIQDRDNTAQRTDRAIAPDRSSSPQAIGQPYCNSADITKHYEIAVKYVQSLDDDLSVVQNSSRQVGPCNNGNTAWTAFDVVEDDGEVEGQIVVNGDTEQARFQEMDDDAIEERRELEIRREVRDDGTIREEIRERIRTDDGDEDIREENRVRTESIVPDRARNSRSFIPETIRNTATDIRQRFQRAIQGNVTAEDVRRVNQEFREEIRTRIENASPDERNDVAREISEEHRERIRELIEERREEAEETREELRRKIEVRKQEIQDKLDEIQDEQVRRIAERINTNLANINERIVNNYLEKLDHMEVILGNIETRADKVEALGGDVSVVRSAVDAAYTQIEDTREIIKAQLDEEYTLTIESPTDLGEAMRTLRDGLREDLESARDELRSVHEAIRSAADNLSEVADTVDDESIDEEDAEEEEESEDGQSTTTDQIN